MLVQERGGEPILQMTCRDRNRLALQADLLFAYSRGIYNVLTLTGDSIDVGDHKEAKPVFDLDSVQLIRLIKDSGSGHGYCGQRSQGCRQVLYRRFRASGSGFHPGSTGQVRKKSCRRSSVFPDAGDI